MNLVFEQSLLFSDLNIRKRKIVRLNLNHIDGYWLKSCRVIRNILFMVNRNDWTSFLCKIFGKMKTPNRSCFLFFYSINFRIQCKSNCWTIKKYINYHYWIYHFKESLNQQEKNILTHEWWTTNIPTPKLCRYSVARFYETDFGCISFYAAIYFGVFASRFRVMYNFN